MPGYVKDGHNNTNKIKNRVYDLVFFFFFVVCEIFLCTLCLIFIAQYIMTTEINVFEFTVLKTRVFSCDNLIESVFESSTSILHRKNTKLREYENLSRIRPTRQCQCRTFCSGHGQTTFSKWDRGQWCIWDLVVLNTNFLDATSPILIECIMNLILTSSNYLNRTTSEIHILTQLNILYL